MAQQEKAKPIEVKPSQLMRMLEVFIQHREPVLIVGAPGTGKSDMMAQACKAAGFDTILSHPGVEDPTNSKGLPFVVDGRADFLPYGDLRRLMETRSPLCYIMDDLGQAPPGVQAAKMQLLLAREVAGHKISDHVTFLAATNRKQDRAGVSGILEPVKSRFPTILNLCVDLDEWIRWALIAGMPTGIIAFNRFRSNHLTAFEPAADIVNSPSPRTMAAAGRIVSYGLAPEDELAALAGAVGIGCATELTAFLRTFRSLPSPEHIVMNPDKAEVPDASRADVLYSLAGTLARRATPNNFDAVLTYAKRLTPEFGVCLVRDATTRDHNLIDTRGYQRWCADNIKFMQ